jgi:gamma-glutamyl:cysteine ligase YbdK (ATP-grasp superfamily)
MSVLEFRSNRRPTLGLELELGLVDGRTFGLCSSFGELVERLPEGGGERFKPELIQSVLEINTDVCENTVDA